MSVHWKTNPSVIGAEIVSRGRRVQSRSSDMMASEASDAESTMKANAPWQDDTGDARAGLYAEVTGSGGKMTIELGTRSNHGPYLELGTVHMAPRPIIAPTMQEVAANVKDQSSDIVRGEFGG